MRNTEVGNEFCCPLMSGMTMGGENLNLTSGGFGGLDCEIALAPDSQFFYSQNSLKLASREECEL